MAKPLLGHNIAVTGETHIISRAQFRQAIEDAGGTVCGQVAPETTILVLGGPGHVSASKVSTAQRLGIRILTEAELMQMIQAQ